MNSFAKNLILIGLGMASMTEEKAREFYNKLIEYGKKYEDSEEAPLGSLLKTYDKAGEKLENIFDEVVENISKNLNIITKKDFEELKRRIEQIEKEIDNIKNQR